MRSAAAFGVLGATLGGACYGGSEDAQSGGETESSSATDGTGAGPGSMSGDPDATASTSASTTASTTTDPTGDTETTGEPPADAPLLDRLIRSDVTVPEGVEAGVQNWRIWGRGSLHVAPVFTAPLQSCETLVGYTSDGGAGITARVAHLDAADALVQDIVLRPGFELRGLAAEPDGRFGALLWESAAQRIHVVRYEPDGTEISSTELTNPDNTPTDFGIGDSRFDYGDGTYGAYYHVHSDSGHEGDTLKWVAAQTGAETTEWGWGCSHSMSNVLRFNPGVGAFLSACVTDCYPGTSGDFATNSIGGIYLDVSDGHIMDVDAGCNGDVAGELGSAALGPSGWSIVFNAHQAPATLGQSSYDPGTMNQDIGFAAVGSDLSSSAVVWLTTTPGDEADPSIARWEPAGDDAEQYVVGWHDAGAGTYLLGRVDAAGAFLEGPVDITAVAQWGRRDDPFRRHLGADVVWAWFDDPGSTTLHFARLQSGSSCVP